MGYEELNSLQNPRTELYHSLAEILADPPGWLSYPGTEWPLFAAVILLTPYSLAAREAVNSLAEIGAESLDVRRTRHTNLFMGSHGPKIWLYESMARSGRLIGPETIGVERVYRSTGVEIVTTELPDHASVELAFLAYLADRQFQEPEQAKLWKKLESRFIGQHAGRWLPDLGRALFRSGDEVFAPVGKLLADWLEENRKPSRQICESKPALPTVQQPDDCPLCGFCVQVCPTHALVIQETAEKTSLLLSTASCVGCGKCERICTFNAIQMTELNSQELNCHNGKFADQSKCDEKRLLRQSVRIPCSQCGHPTVSQAEFDFVVAKIGKQTWLDSCLTCR